MLIAVALCGAAAVAGHLLRSQPDTFVGCAPVAKPFDGEYVTWVHLTMKDFHPQGNEFSGALASSVDLRSAQVLLGEGGQMLGEGGGPYKPPDPKVLRAQFDTMQKTFKETMLRFNHYTDAHGYEEQGGSVGTFAMAAPELRTSLEGKSTFTWTATAETRAFYYPFDQYVLAVNPELMTAMDADSFLDYPVDQLTMDFSGTGFVPRLQFLGDFKERQKDRQKVIVQRPMLLRVITGVVGVLLAVWLLYLIVSPKSGEQVGQVVTLFVGVFSVRNSLLSGAPVFPSFIDYCTLGVYLAAVLIVLIRWAVPDKHGPQCPHCKSPLAAGATVCAACTRDVAAA